MWISITALGYLPFVGLRGLEVWTSAVESKSVDSGLRVVTWGVGEKVSIHSGIPACSLQGYQKSELRWPSIGFRVKGQSLGEGTMGGWGIPSEGAGWGRGARMHAGLRVWG